MSDRTLDEMCACPDGVCEDRRWVICKLQEAVKRLNPSVSRPAKVARAGQRPSNSVAAALEMLIREAQAVADDHHQPRYTRLDEALRSAREALCTCYQTRNGDVDCPAHGQRADEIERLRAQLTDCETLFAAYDPDKECGYWQRTSSPDEDELVPGDRSGAFRND